MSASELNHNKNGDVAEEVNNAATDAATTGASKAEQPTDPDAALISPTADNKKTPVKRTPSKRLSFIERAQKESEELVRTMGGNLQMEGGRRTRSSMRGTPTATTAVSPPPAKKARNSPSTATPKGRGRGRKLDTPSKTPENADIIEEPEKDATVGKSPAKGKSKKNVESIEEEKVANNNEVTKKTEEPVENDQTDSTKSEENSKKTVEQSAEKEVISDEVENNVDNIKESTDEKDDESSPMEFDEKAEVVEDVTATEKEEKTESSVEPAEAMEVDEVVADKVEHKTASAEEQSHENQNDIDNKKIVDDIKEDEVDTNDKVIADAETAAATDDDGKITEPAAEVPVANVESTLPSATIETNSTNSGKPTIATDDDIINDNVTVTQTNIKNGAQEEETIAESTEDNNVSNKLKETSPIKVQNEQPEELKHASTNDTSVNTTVTTIGGGA